MLQTKRLRLRQWLPEDIEPFACMNGDADVMRYFERPQTVAESRSLIARQQEQIAQKGYGLWAAERLSDNRFVGFIGLADVSSDLCFAPATEIGWRLDKSAWGQGLAPEGARACLAFAFSALGLKQVVSFTAMTNQPSIRVMEKIGMRRDHSGDFDHPRVGIHSSVRPHVLYRIQASDPIRG